MSFALNLRSAELLGSVAEQTDSLRIARQEISDRYTLWDFGVETEGGLNAGLLLSRLCLAGLADVSLTTSPLAGMDWPTVAVQTDHPLPACLFSQYAGWSVSVDKFFGMGSGPMRAAASQEPLFEEFQYREDSEHLVGILETDTLPTADVFDHLAEKSGSSPRITLAVAPTASQAGNVQIVARSVETALHKLHEVGFDVQRVRSGFGTAPLPPVATDFLTGLGRTNDAILYGGRVTLWVTGDDESLETIGPKVPASSSNDYGRPFQEIFKAANHDFYKIDPLLFSPAEIVLHNLDTGRVFRFGETDEAVLQASFGVS
ncbi:methenyltetrahydromethanopterin cyclohydrolase [Thalassoroseus pseudoceratinae]|uniref:methenyltetrahydromethanopterin cyclohydrolase n=1 Tax=Thalassoroseus pseudoceratinae TaxID=2713176 RepID=UPI00141FD400|nr:methenyltetrahydromethanopterin cyclohydrolase [Thalassoroseus pseudoceratinae]